MTEPIPASEELDIPADWLEEFEAAARRPLPLRFRYSFIRTYKPVMDDEPFRAFNTTAEYRQWCEDNLPDWRTRDFFSSIYLSHALTAKR